MSKQLTTDQNNYPHTCCSLTPHLPDFSPVFPLATILNPSPASSVLISDTHILLLHVLVPTENVWMTLPISISSINFKLHETVEFCDLPQTLFYFLMSSVQKQPSPRISALVSPDSEQILYFSVGITVLKQTQVFNHTTLLIISCPHLASAIQTEVLVKLFLS